MAPLAKSKPRPERLADIAGASFVDADRIAVSGAGEALSYRGLDRRINLARGAYAALGLKPGDRVALLLPTCAEFVIAYFGAHRAGLVVVPLNPLLGVDEITYILGTMQPALVVAAAPDAPYPVLAQLDRILAQACPSAQLACYGDGMAFDRILARASASLPPAPRDDDDEVLILFTSGTSGKPKGASHTQRAVMANARHANRALGITGSDVMLCPLPLSHVFGQMVMMLGALLAGAELRLVPRPTAGAMLEAMGQSGATFAAGVPTLFAALAEHAIGEPAQARLAGAKLRMAMAGGAPLPPATAAAFRSAFGVPLHQGYGMTEVACCIALERAGRPSNGGVGKICDPLEHRIAPVRADAPDEGELELRGANLFRGYYLDGVLEPRPPEQWFSTGDVVRRDRRGQIFLCDRKKEMIIRNGYNVYPSEVEATLASHPDVLMAAVVGVDDPAVGQEVAAFVSVRSGATVTVDELAAWCRARIALYKYPRLVALLPALPTNATGKVLKRALDPKVLSRVGAG